MKRSQVPIAQRSRLGSALSMVLKWMDYSDKIQTRKKCKDNISSSYNSIIHFLKHL